MLSYDAFAFRQVTKGPVQLAFVATSAEIDRWAKVPTKMSRRPNAFQRPAIEAHVAEVRTFFTDSSKANSSPTAIILGFEPEQAHTIRLLTSKGGPPLDEAAITDLPQKCWVEIDFAPWPSSDYADKLDDEIKDLFNAVKGIYPTLEDDNSEDEALVVPDNEAHEVEDEDDDGDDEDADTDTDDDDDDDDAAPSKVDAAASSTPTDAIVKVDPEKIENTRIKLFFDHLRPDELTKICTSGSYRGWSVRQKEVLRDLLKDDRKPGLIIDGQHRVKGTAQHAKVPFLISFVPWAGWAELAFQFIVNNGSAKKVGEGLLISIVGESLDPEQLRSIEERLYRAKIKVSLIQAVMLVQEGDSPFRGMLEFSTPGEKGFLEAPAMQKKVVRLWYGARDQSGNSGRFAQLKMKDRNPLSMKEMFAASCAGTNAKDRVNDWQSRQKWFVYFAAFWRAVATHFQPRLWPATQADWPSKSRHARAVDKERLKLMRVTVLGILQEAVLTAWSTDVTKERKRKKKTSMSDFKISPADFEEAIAGYVQQIPPDFFTEITYTGFDGSPSLRDDLRNQMLQLMEKGIDFADIRAKHKFWKN